MLLPRKISQSRPRTKPRLWQLALDEEGGAGAGGAVAIMAADGEGAEYVVGGVAVAELTDP